MKPQRRQPPPETAMGKCSPLRGTNNRSRSEVLLQCVQSGPRSVFPGPSVKDLRSRRVFSTPSLRENVLKERKDEIRGGVEMFLREKAAGVDRAIFRTPVVESTPPDRDAVSQQEGCRSVSFSEKAFDKETTRFDGVIGKKLGIAQKSQLKLFWNSSSHCYRRLLPFLIHVTKNNSCTLEILPCTNYAKKVDTAPKGGPSMQSATLPAENSSLMNSAKKLDEDPVEELFTQSSASQTHDNSYASPEKEVVVAGFPPNEQIIESQPHLLCSENENMMVEKSTNNGQDNEAPVIHNFTLTTDQTPVCRIDEYSLLYMPECSLPIAREPLSVQELTGCTTCTSELNRTATSATGCSQVTLSISEDDKPFSRTLHSATLGLKRCSTAVPEKGILKRQRRGCKGACTCLDCSSFFFHAQKAFEFSKKQMLDAEDVTVGLMKELAFLRRMIVGTSGSQGQAVLEHNKVQEICRRSSRAEEMARMRLKEMATELDIHCRTTNSPHSRVTFAESVEERIIPRSDNICRSKTQFF